MKNWETCPKCNGQGGKFTNFGCEICSVCNGQKIINSFTGKPPEDTITLSNFGIVNGKLTKIF